MVGSKKAADLAALLQADCNPGWKPDQVVYNFTPPAIGSSSR